jgi:Spy/CpxP family protein refolding chaperone
MKQIGSLFIRRKWLMGALLLLVFLGLGASVYAFRMGSHGGCKYGKRHHQMRAAIQKLNLSTAQKLRLIGVFRQVRQGHKQDRAKLEATHARLLQVLSQESPNKSELDAAVLQALNTIKDLAMSKSTYILRVHAILTEQQRQILHGELQKMHKRWERVRAFRNMVESLNLTREQQAKIENFALAMLQQWLQDNPKMSNHPRWKKAKHLYDTIMALNLSEDQKARLMQILRQARPGQTAEISQIEPIRAQLMRLLLEQDPKPEQLTDIINHGFNTAQQIILSKTSYVLQAHQVLSGGQRQILLEAIKRHRTHIEQMRKRHQADHPSFVPPFLR